MTEVANRRPVYTAKLTEKVEEPSQSNETWKTRESRRKYLQIRQHLDGIENSLNSRRKKVNVSELLKQRENQSRALEKYTPAVSK